LFWWKSYRLKCLSFNQLWSQLITVSSSPNSVNILPLVLRDNNGKCIHVLFSYHANLFNIFSALFDRIRGNPARAGAARSSGICCYSKLFLHRWSLCTPRFFYKQIFMSSKRSKLVFLLHEQGPVTITCFLVCNCTTKSLKLRIYVLRHLWKMLLIIDNFCQGHRSQLYKAET
jgi:hypothetical protein